ncbi:hypothetical protein EB118_07810 [bacterium]|nr:hypothetical protein [bacterium]NDC95167.1 hypothetical protein [bacterium]NDD84843.1 hypothetical protein [bacterium]NDG29983.1 hypothetical protein [bacterium]
MNDSNNGNLTFVSSYYEAEQLKQQLVNLGANENDIITKFVSGPNQYLVRINSNDYNNEFSERLEKFLHDNEWITFRKIEKLSDGTYL